MFFDRASAVLSAGVSGVSRNWCAGGDEQSKPPLCVFSAGEVESRPSSCSSRMENLFSRTILWCSIWDRGCWSERVPFHLPPRAVIHTPDWGGVEQTVIFGHTPRLWGYDQGFDDWSEPVFGSGDKASAGMLDVALTMASIVKQNLIFANFLRVDILFSKSDIFSIKRAQHLQPAGNSGNSIIEDWVGMN